MYRQPWGIYRLQYLDAYSGYWQVEAVDKDKDRTAFTSHKGLYRLKLMAFGLKNAPGTFQRAIDDSVVPMKWQIALVYPDDFVILSKTKTEDGTYQPRNAGAYTAAKAGLSLKLITYPFFTNTVGHLYNENRPRRLEIASHTMDAIKQLKNRLMRRTYAGSLDFVKFSDFSSLA